MVSSIPARSNENDNRFLKFFNFVEAETIHNRFLVKTFLRKINNMGAHNCTHWSLIKNNPALLAPVLTRPLLISFRPIPAYGTTEKSYQFWKRKQSTTYNLWLVQSFCQSQKMTEPSSFAGRMLLEFIAFSKIFFQMSPICFVICVLYFGFWKIVSNSVFFSCSATLEILYVFQRSDYSQKVCKIFQKQINTSFNDWIMKIWMLKKPYLIQ